ncbi:osmoprotectant transport system substrate-binding protein [Pseudonocardia hierapolitana]|uniref:Osmoprotectant transport system substrate-binding protein n=1 Tax=Pseudonocardia hierapolitana TaxID=1128676 RepID=A0A561SUX3_9PSEU|nr:ABC transporter substrate-binding protein [Pseudonocardia hierapolitana]TWF78654.1 osmoprotectant transport system substrate-binding protein [Pseudonocardia hierapolitana]
MKRTLAALTGLLALGLTACGGGGDPLAGGPSGSPDAGPPAAADVIKVGSANFTESRLLAEIYAQALEAKGAKVERSFGIGSREVYFPALQDGSIDLIPEYTGNLLQEIDPQATATASDQVYQELTQKLPDPLIVLDQSKAEDKDAVVVTQETAQRYNARSLADLAPHCGELVFGGPPEFAERPYGLPGIERLYGCTFADFRSLDAGGPLTVAALTDGTIQAADLFTTDPTIADRGWVVLEDPKNNFAAQNVVPLVNETKANDQVRETLNSISAALTTDGLLELNRKVADAATNTVESVAKEWVTANNLG